MNRIEILPNLWISTTASANNKDMNVLTNISILINAEKELDFIYKQIYSNYDIIKLNKYLIKITEYIHSQLKNNKAILIFCNNLKKSILIICAYLIKYGKILKDNAMNIINSKYYDSDNFYNTQNLLNELLDKIIL